MTGKAAKSVYAGRDAGDLASYYIPDAARYLGLPSATLRTWVAGRHYPTKQHGRTQWPRLINPADNQNRLSFDNLIEAFVLRALRTTHRVSVPAVRTAMQVAEKKFGIRRLLLSPELRAGAGQLFLERYSDLINLSASRQLVMKEVLLIYLKRVEWDERLFPRRLYPLIGNDLHSPKVVAIDPYIAFGRPIVAARSISTSVITDRIDAGESVTALAADYDLNEQDILQAVLYERAA